MNRTLIGCNYFAGWWKELPNKWGNWREKYPERIPLLGDFNTQETMDQEIVAASQHGIDFFSILWYFNDPDKEREPHSRLLNRGLEYFMASPNASQMKFSIEFCNAPPYKVETDEEWKSCVETFVSAMKHPSYLRVGDRPVIKVHSVYYFNLQNGDRGAARLEEFRQAAKDAGVGDPLIGCGVMSSEKFLPGRPEAKLFDFTATYMDLPLPPPQPTDYPFEQLADFIAASRKEHAQDAVPYLPFVAAGWNPRPWKDLRASFALPNHEQWKRELQQMADDLAKVPNLGLPLPGGSRQPAFTIYAWNEFGEGGFIAPTKAAGYDKLEAISEVFAGTARR